MAGVELSGYRLVKKPRDDEREHNMSTLNHYEQISQTQVQFVSEFFF